MANIGRPSPYDPDIHPAQAEALAMLGKTNTEIAEEMGIATSTFHLWRSEHPAFSDAVKRGKEAPNDQVEASLYKRANGYKFVEVKQIADANGNVLKKETVVKEIAPDTTAQIFWLKNRRPKEWRDRVQQEISGPDGGPIEITRMTDDELELRAKQILTRRSGNTD
jgi:hypothetical protein